MLVAVYNAHTFFILECRQNEMLYFLHNCLRRIVRFYGARKFIAGCLFLANEQYFEAGYSTTSHLISLTP